MFMLFSLQIVFYVHVIVFKEQAYISVGFNSWKKASECFETYQQTNCHKVAPLLETVVMKCANIAELTNQWIVDSLRKERKCLIDVI